MVNATTERNGPSWRMIVALGQQVKGMAYTPGQSGIRKLYYDNLLESWRKRIA
jgi:penicillin amidase